MTAIDRYEDRNIQVWDYTLHNYFRRPATSWHKVADQAIRVMSLHVPSFITSSSKRAAFIYRVVPTIVMENQLNIGLRHSPPNRGAYQSRRQRLLGLFFSIWFALLVLSSPSRPADANDCCIVFVLPVVPGAGSPLVWVVSY